jgi:myo-inositol-1-phosphate synthase
LTWGAWWTYNETNASTEPDDFGVYELGDENKETVYYGSGKIKTRLLNHLNKKECPLARFYRIEVLGSEDASKAKEKALLEDYKRAHDGKLPIYNERIG